MKKVIVIVGPTSVGKTAIGIRLAQDLHTEIISGDSVQVYRRLNIGSAKATPEELRLVKHHLIDILEPNEPYSVCDFQRQARLLMEKLPLPMIVGGTGLYIKAALSNYEFDAPKRDVTFGEQYGDYSNEEIYDILKELDFLAAEKIHPNNRKRVLRAMEAAIAQEKLSGKTHKDELLYDPYIIYLSLDRSKLYERINARVDLMFEHGLVQEVTDLYQEGIAPHAIGYQEFMPYFRGEADLDAVKEEIKKATRHLAKRQTTWFKNQMVTHFYEVNLENLNETYQKIYADVKLFLSKE